jgi:hypothetical protein
LNPLINRQKSDNGKGDVPAKMGELEPWEAIGQGALKIAGEENELDLPLGLDLSRRIGKSDREIASQGDFDIVRRIFFTPDNKSLLAHRPHRTACGWAPTPLAGPTPASLFFARYGIVVLI